MEIPYSQMVKRTFAKIKTFVPRLPRLHLYQDYICTKTTFVPRPHLYQDYICTKTTFVPRLRGWTGTFVLGWRYGSERTRRAWPGFKWVRSLRKLFKIIFGPGWRSPLSHPGQTATAKTTFVQRLPRLHLYQD